MGRTCPICSLSNTFAEEMIMSLIEKALRQLEKDKHAVSYDAYPVMPHPAAAEEVYEKADAAGAEHFMEERREPRPGKQIITLGVVFVLGFAALWYMQRGGVTSPPPAALIPQLKAAPVRAIPNTGSSRTAFAPQLQRDERRVAINAAARGPAVESGDQQQIVTPAASRAAQDNAASMKKQQLFLPAAKAPQQQAPAMNQAAPRTAQTSRRAEASRSQEKKIKTPAEAVNERTANLLQQEAEDADSLNNTGVILLEKGAAAQAQAYFAKALQLTPDHEKALNNMGLSLYAQGRTAEALNYYKRAVKVNPGTIETYVNMGIAFRSRGDLTQAAEVFQKALMLKPAHPETLYNYGLLLKDMGQQEKSRSCFEQFLKTAPPHLQGVADSVRIYLQAATDQQQ
jgi:tetratricopeptide (TPR) repeat protein